MCRYIQSSTFYKHEKMLLTSDTKRLWDYDYMKTSYWLMLVVIFSTFLPFIKCVVSLISLPLFGTLI